MLPLLLNVVLLFSYGQRAALDQKQLTQLQCISIKEISASKKDRTYKALRKAFDTNKVTTSEILARLIHAETVAAGPSCQVHADIISRYIADVLYYRIQKRNGDILGVIFEPSQFASSLHIYKESAVQEFVCPSAKPTWKQIKKWAQDIEKSNYKAFLPPDTVHYYLYKHSQRFKVPAWTKNLKEVSIPETQIASCIRFFENRNFK